MSFITRRGGDARSRILHRALWVCCLAAASAGALLARAQYIRPRNKGPHTGPRAVAVLENIPAKNSSKPSARYNIIPVTIFYQGQYYDASVYKAAPVPMALLAQTVYDVEQGGAPKGTIEVGMASPTPNGWRADGTLTAPGAPPEHKPSLGEVKEPENSDDRPRLHRGGAPQPTTPAQSTSTNPALPESTKGSDSASGPPQSASKPSDAPTEPDDPNRPRLQRGKPRAGAPSAERADSDIAATTPETAETGKTPASSAKPTATLVAVSDVEASDPHVYTLQWSTAELGNLSKAATQQAEAEVAKYVEQHFPSAASAPSTARATTMKRTGTHTPAVPVQLALRDVEVHAFDLDFDNDPEIVLTGQRSVNGADGTAHTIFVTYVVREEGGRDFHPLLSYITDDTRLDEFPRLTLIDAVDADGDGIGELLFRTSSAVEAQGHNFRLYATGPDRLRIVFDSRGAQD